MVPEDDAKLPPELAVDAPAASGPMFRLGAAFFRRPPAVGGAGAAVAVVVGLVVVVAESESVSPEVIPAADSVAVPKQVPALSLGLAAAVECTGARKWHHRPAGWPCRRRGRAAWAETRTCRGTRILPSSLTAHTRGRTQTYPPLPRPPNPPPLQTDRSCHRRDSFPDRGLVADADGTLLRDGLLQLGHGAALADAAEGCNPRRPTDTQLHTCRRWRWVWPCFTVLCIAGWLPVELQ